MKNLIFSMKKILKEKQAIVNANNDFCTIELETQGYKTIIAIQKFKDVIKMRYSIGSFTDFVFWENANDFRKELSKEILNIIDNPYLIYNLKNAGILENKKTKNKIFVKF